MHLLDETSAPGCSCTQGCPREKRRSQTQTAAVQRRHPDCHTFCWTLHFHGLEASQLILAFAGVPKVKAQKTDAESSARSSAAKPGPQVHHDVECDSCGVKPIRGARYKSQVSPDTLHM